MTILNSARLHIRPFLPADIDLLYHLDSDPTVLKYIGPPKTQIESKDRFEKINEIYRLHPGFGKFTIIHKKSNQAIGWVWIGPLDGDWGTIEIGYRLKSDTWGNGYATEISKKLLDYGFQVKNLDKIVGVTHLENIASQKVLQNIGLRFIDERFVYQQQVKYFEITKDQYYEAKD